MFHVIDRPPFDDFTFGLFLELFKRRAEFGLKNAEFIYTWTAHLSIQNGSIRKKNLFDPGSLRQVPEKITDLYFWKFGYNHILGESKYINHVDDLYQHFLESMSDHPGFRSDLYDDFCYSYNTIHKSVMDKKQIEYKIHEILKSTSVVVFFVKDHFRVDLHKSWIISVPEISEYFSNMCEYYSDKQIVLVTSLENLDKEINKPNCTIIPMGGDITNQISRFKEYRNSSDKKFNNKRVISLNRGVRNHRTYLVSLLYGLELEKYVDISYLGMKNVNTSDIDDYVRYDKHQDPLYDTIKKGFAKFSAVEKNYDDEDVYSGALPNDNIFNFNSTLYNKYQSSLVEFITETNYNELSFNVTEKFSHSIFGYNIPIIVSSPGYVEFLREVGFDVFDDLVDHSYDTIKDKTSRLHSLVTKNYDIITSDLSEKVFFKNKSRFDFNCTKVVNDLSTFYYRRFWQKIKDIKL